MLGTLLGLIVLIFGLIGYAMKRVRLPMAPLVLGLVIGPLFEKALVQTTSIGNGNALIIFQRPVALIVLALAVLIVALPSIVAKVRPRRPTDERDKELVNS